MTELAGVGFAERTRASPSETITTTYDDAGRVTGISDAFSTYSFGYDNADRLTSEDNRGTPGMPRVVLTSAYDAAGNRTSLTDSLGGVTSYTYDPRNEITAIAQSGTGVTSRLAKFTYDNAGNLTGLTRYSNLAGTQTVLSTTFTYDAAERLTGLTHKTAGGTVRASYGYTLDAADRLTQETRSWNSGAATDTLTYTYTDDNQLTGVAHTNGSFAAESFSYDANGNRAMSGYATGTGNRLSSDGTYNYTYDNEGNLTAKTTIASGDQTLYSYDYRNRLTAVDSKVGGVTTPVARYTYDALDRRIKVVEGSTTTWTAYDGTTPILDFNGSGSQTARYLPGPSAAGVDAVLARETPSGGVAWYLQDRLGTVRDLVDNTGAVIDHIDYGAFGDVLSESSPSAGGRLAGFAGLERDSATGLSLAIHRVLLSAAGIWTTEDPLGFAAGDPNISRYVGNGPTNAADPLGLGCDKRPRLGPGEGLPINYKPKGPNDIPSSLKGKWKVTIVAGGGHAYIRFESLDTGEVHTIGRYDKFFGGRQDDRGEWIVPPVKVPGLQWDRDLIKEEGFKDGKFPSRTVVIENPKIYVGPGGQYGYYWYNNNCTTYATEAWEYYSGESFSRPLIWADVPEGLEAQIRWADDREDHPAILDPPGSHWMEGGGMW